ncbi:hypothetical protein [Clostridium sp. HV4-5-A1G]|uniref:hypothetical protein n=1 Tax=Clostridium sp. HV4-5-A1G TaxID=2004595 RepID=UPI00123B6C5E|nr:hypothetical protein [Clostridium sp. HV4-5-A1G]KAA8663137.1 hypothetical protein F3O63_18430 [Clostridium sp. HV4-5-A1G]
MSDSITITSIVCVAIVSIVGIFAMLAYLKERAILKYKNSSKHSNTEISITADSDKENSSKN